MIVPSPRLLEVCVDTPAGVMAAAEGGADRIELCAALALGGLTPTASLVRFAGRSPLPVHMLARVREGDFVHTAAEAALVADDIRMAAEVGLEGVVIGASVQDRKLHTGLLAEWVDHARTLGVARGSRLSLTLHRAFDLTPDPAAALEQAIALGFDRVLTSGGQPRAIDGTATLARLHAEAAGRIILLAGSGVNTAVLPRLLATGIREVHASCRTILPMTPDMPERRFGFRSAQAAITDPVRVAELAHALRTALE